MVILYDACESFRDASCMIIRLSCCFQRHGLHRVPPFAVTGLYDLLLVT